MRRGFFVPSKWRFPERQRMTFPVEVILNRLATPRCVFAFIFVFFFTIPSFWKFSSYLALRGHRLHGARRALFRREQS